MSDNDKPAKVGRPTAYKKEYAELAKNYCLLGATDKQLASFFDVTDRTIDRWKKSHPEFCLSLKAGKVSADAQVAESLFNRALGYKHEEDKIFLFEGQPVIVPTEKHYPPDSTSMIFWLKNRQPDLWREKPDEFNNQDNDSVSSIQVSIVK